MTRRLALQELKRAERLAQLAEHQRDDVLRREMQSEAAVAIAIQQCYRHLFYPARAAAIAPTDLAHTAIEIGSASERPGSGQQQVVRQLRELNKLRLGEDLPDSPSFIRDSTPLRRGQITTAALREEFRRDTALPMLAGDEIFKRAIRNGVAHGEYVHRRGELLYGPGDPQVAVEIDEDATVFTMGFATERGIWPRPVAAPGAPPSFPHGQPAPATPALPGFREPDGGMIVGSDQTAPLPVSAPMLCAEAVLKEALTILWETARQRRAQALAWIDIRMFDTSDAFRLLGAIGAVPNADRQVRLRGGYETPGGSSLELDFTGTPDDAKPIKDFIEPLQRAATERTLEAGFRLTFNDGLPLAGDAPEKLAERLTRIGAAAAYVSASAEATP